MKTILLSLATFVLLAIPAQANPPFRFGGVVVVPQPVPVVNTGFAFASQQVGVAGCNTGMVPLSGNVSVFQQSVAYPVGVNTFGFNNVGVGGVGFGFGRAGFGFGGFRGGFVGGRFGGRFGGRLR